MKSNSDEKKIFSQHIFLFPFKINLPEHNGKSKSKYDSSIEKLEEISRLILSDKKWQYRSFNFPTENGLNKDAVWAYNEEKYFHPYTNAALFNKSCETSSFQEKQTPISNYYDREIREDDKIEFGILDKIYTLNINHLSLRIFETGIGILTITLYNLDEQQSALSDILLINDFGRRIYPQFLGETDGITATKNNFLPQYIKMYMGEEEIYESFNEKDYLNKLENNYAEYIKQLIHPLKDITPVMDDRMFVMCWYGNTPIMNNLKRWRKNQNGFNYEQNTDWYKYVFVDGKYPGVYNKQLMKKLIQESTYARFVEMGTLYGVTRYSFMCLTDDDWYGYNIVRNHMQKVYYQMIVLILAQRASLLKFNFEMERIAGLADEIYRSKKVRSKDNIVRKIEVLNKDIILFLNRMWFLEITPQEQGIELYNLLQSKIGINEQIEELRTEIKELYDFIELKVEQRSANNLTMMGLLFIPLSLVTGLFGINLYFFRNINESASVDRILHPYLSSSLIFFFISYILIRFTTSLFETISNENTRLNTPVIRWSLKSLMKVDIIISLIIAITVFILAII